AGALSGAGHDFLWRQDVPARIQGRRVRGVPWLVESHTPHRLRSRSHPVQRWQAGGRLRRFPHRIHARSAKDRIVGTAGRAARAARRLAAGLGRRWLQDLARELPALKRCALVLAVVLAALYGRDLAQGRSLARVDLLCDDALLREAACPGRIPPIGHSDYSPALVSYPYEWWNAHELQHGRMPAWNPLVGMGAPTRVTFQGAWLNPMRLPFYLRPS